jgi:hypothetical protein
MKDLNHLTLRSRVNRLMHRIRFLKLRTPHSALSGMKDLNHLTLRSRVNRLMHRIRFLKLSTPHLAE